MRRALPRLFLAALVVAAGEGLSHLAIAWLEYRTDAVFLPVAERHQELSRRVGEVLDSQGEALVELDSELGWRYRANHRGARYSSNARRLRGSHVYGPPRPGVTRISAYGASFVHANEVRDSEAWSAVLEASRPDVEVLNRGVGGYGTDQALLLMRRELAADAPEIVLLGFAEIDLVRNVNRFRRFLSPRDLPLSKPRFVLEPDGALRLLPNPLPERSDWEALRRHPELALESAPGDAFFEPWVWRNPLYDHSATVRLLATALPRLWRSRLGPEAIYHDGQLNPRSEGFEVTAALIEQFAREVRDTGREFWWMVFPTRNEAIWGEGPRAYAPLLQRLAALPRIDLADALAAAPDLSPERLWAPGGHYSVAANAVVARAVADAVLGPRKKTAAAAAP